MSIVALIGCIGLFGDGILLFCAAMGWITVSQSLVYIGASAGCFSSIHMIADYMAREL